MTDSTEVPPGQLQARLVERMLKAAQSLAKPYDQLTEGKQRTFLRKLEDVARGLIYTTHSTIASNGYATVNVTLGQLTVEKGVIKGKFEAVSTTDNLTDLHAFQGHPVTLALTDAETYRADDGPQPEPDEPTFPDDDPDGPMPPPALPDLRGQNGSGDVPPPPGE